MEQLSVSSGGCGCPSKVCGCPIQGLLLALRGGFRLTIRQSRDIEKDPLKPALSAAEGGHPITYLGHAPRKRERMGIILKDLIKV